MKIGKCEETDGLQIMTLDGEVHAYLIPKKDYKGIEFDITYLMN